MKLILSVRLLHLTLMLHLHESLEHQLVIIPPAVPTRLGHKLLLALQALEVVQKHLVELLRPNVLLHLLELSQKLQLLIKLTLAALAKVPVRILRQHTVLLHLLQKELEL